MRQGNTCSLYLYFARNLPNFFLMMYSVNIWLIIELNLRWREIKVSTKYPITSNTPNSILTKGIKWKIKKGSLEWIILWCILQIQHLQLLTKTIKLFIFMKILLYYLRAESAFNKLPFRLEIRQSRLVTRSWHYSQRCK